MSALTPHVVTWSRNMPTGIQFGTDKADSFEEACALAETRVRGGGIPATAVIKARDEAPVLRHYVADMDARVSYVDAMLAARESKS